MNDVATPNSVNKTGTGGTFPCNGMWVFISISKSMLEELASATVLHARDGYGNALKAHPVGRR